MRRGGNGGAFDEVGFGERRVAERAGSVYPDGKAVCGEEVGEFLEFGSEVGGEDVGEGFVGSKGGEGERNDIGREDVELGERGRGHREGWWDGGTWRC